MTESDVKEQINREPTVPFRLHLASGKTFDITRQDAAWPLKNCLLVFRNLASEGQGAESYDLFSYPNIERIEPLNLGKRNIQKRRPA